MTEAHHKIIKSKINIKTENIKIKNININKRFIYLKKW